MLLANDVRAVFWVAVVPALIAVAILFLAVKEPRHLVPMHRRFVDLRPRDLPGTFWRVAAVAAMFTLARFSEAFLVLRGSNTGMSITWTPLVLVVMNIAYMLSAYPAGALADRMPRVRLLMLGCVILVASNLVLASAQTTTIVLVGTALWGLHMGFTEGVFSAMVADAAPASLRGTAFGVFNLLRGVLLMVASVVAGLLWDRVSPAATFLAGAALAASALLLARLVRPAMVSAGKGRPERVRTP
jgi:MFS family permease